ncbi:hypothetical protein SLA2020_100800 [Shorea laevis]
MALSFCSNSDVSLQYHLNTEMEGFLHSQPQLECDLFGFNNSLALPDPCFDPILQPEELCYSDIYSTTHLLPPFPSPSIFPHQDQFESYSQYHQKSCANLAPEFFTSTVPAVEYLPEILAPLPELIKAPSTSFNYGKSDETGRKAGDQVNLSPQSIAARERRRKITKKTQELGSLIPGGQKMNTAEMLQAAYKYVKFLQAQVGLLQIMSLIQEKKEIVHTEELPSLLASQAIQEKLYSSEKCLIPKEFVGTLANDPEIQSRPLISHDIHHLLRIDG